MIAEMCVKLGLAARYLRILHTRRLTKSECAILAAWCILGVTNPVSTGGWPVKHSQAPCSLGEDLFRPQDNPYANCYVTKPVDLE